MIEQLPVHNQEEARFDSIVDVEEEDQLALSKPRNMIASYMNGQ